MKQYEKDLKRVQRLTRNGSEFTDMKEAAITEENAYLLKSLGLIKMFAIGDNELGIQITDSGVTYFLDKANARKDFAKNHLANFITGFLSGLLVGSLVPIVIKSLAI